MWINSVKAVRVRSVPDGEHLDALRGSQVDTPMSDAGAEHFGAGTALRPRHGFRGEGEQVVALQPTLGHVPHEPLAYLYAFGPMDGQRPHEGAEQVEHEHAMTGVHQVEPVARLLHVRGLRR